MSTSTKAGYVGRRRAEDLPVRRWLQLGAASAGMGAALIGWSLVGSEVGTASADSGVGSSSAGPAPSSSKRADADSRSTPRKVNRTVASGGADAPAQAASRSNRVTAGGSASVADRLANASRVATARSTPPSAAQKASALPMATAASRSDPLGALGKFLTGSLKELLNRKTTLNPLQKLDDLTPKQKSLLDLIPKIPVRKEDALWYRQIQAREAETQRRVDANQRQMDEILQKGVKLTDRNGTPVYTIDGKAFVKYTNVFADRPPQPSLVRISDHIADRNKDIIIRNVLKLEPAQVRSMWKK